MATLLVFLLAITLASAEMSRDIYLPTLPSLVHFFKTTDETVQLTLSLNLVGVAFSRLFYGPLSDCFGRRIVLIIGLIIFTIGTLLCGISPSIYALIFSRFIQGAGEGCVWVVFLAILKDTITNEETYTRIMSIFRAVVAVSLAAAPVIGSLIANAWNWRATFLINAFVSVIALIALFMKLPETTNKDSRHVFSVKGIIRNYRVLLSSFDFVGNCMISGLGLAGLWLFIAASPFIYIEDLGYTRLQFSYWMIYGIAAFMMGVVYQNWASKRYNKTTIMYQGVLCLVTAGACLLLMGLLSPKSPYLLRLFTGFFASGMALIFTCVNMRALEVFPSMSGASSSLLGSIELVIASTSIPLLSTLTDLIHSSVQALCYLTAVCSTLIFFLFKAVEKHKRKKEAEIAELT